MCLRARLDELGALQGQVDFQGRGFVKNCHFVLAGVQQRSDRHECFFRLKNPVARHNLMVKSLATGKGLSRPMAGNTITGSTLINPSETPQNTGLMQA